MSTRKQNDADTPGMGGRYIRDPKSGKLKQVETAKAPADTEKKD